MRDQCPVGVKRVVPEVCWSLLVYLQLRTYRCSALSGAMCQKRSFKPVESELACVALSPFALSGKEADA